MRRRTTRARRLVRRHARSTPPATERQLMPGERPLGLLQFHDERRQRRAELVEHLRVVDDRVLLHVRRAARLPSRRAGESWRLQNWNRCASLPSGSAWSNCASRRLQSSIVRISSTARRPSRACASQLSSCSIRGCTQLEAGDRDRRAAATESSQLPFGDGAGANDLLVVLLDHPE